MFPGGGGGGGGGGVSSSTLSTLTPIETTDEYLSPSKARAEIVYDPSETVVVSQL